MEYRKIYSRMLKMHIGKTPLVSLSPCLLVSLCLCASVAQIVSPSYVFSMSLLIPQQVVELEKQALATVQQLPVSHLDPELPDTSFATWFSQLVGPKAGVVWQLSECGELGDPHSKSGRDLMACTEANAVLPDGRKVMIAIRIGTFKRGISGKPVFCYAIIEHDDELYPTRRLRDLPNHLRPPTNTPVRLPDVAVKSPLAIQYFEPAYLTLSKVISHPYPESEVAPDAPPPKPTPSREPPAPPKPQNISEALLRGRAIVRINPDPPANTGSMPIFFRSVAVEILVSEKGRVIQAKAVSGHPTLRGPAVEAARKWVFEPSTLNGQPVKVESVLTFVFSAGSQ
jgi:Gram-negative bacterial TonB protein C-terminal